MNFTCATTGYGANDGKEFIALGTSCGEIHVVNINGTSFVKDIGYVIPDETPILSMSGDQKSKTLAVGLSTGSVLIFTCISDNFKVLYKIH